MGHLRRYQPRTVNEMAAAAIAPRNNNWTEKGNFRPQPRGKLARAFVDGTSLAKIAPESPQPAEMLEHITIVGEDNLTADDEALHVLLVAHAYEQTDRLMDRSEYSIPTSYALSLLGENARRRGLKASLERLRSTTVSFGVAGGRKYEGVQLLVPWSETDNIGEEIHYIIPKPIQILMASQDRYAHLELAPLGMMKSRYGIRLYRNLALAMARKRWSKDSDNLHTIRVPVDQMRSWLGFIGPVGQLKLRAVDPAIRDLRHVRRFKIVPADGERPKRDDEDVVKWVGVARAEKRGAPVEAWEFILKLSPPRRYHVAQQGLNPKLMWSVGAPDALRFRVPQSFWLRASKFARDNGLASGHHGVLHSWLVAINEALTEVPVTDGRNTREFRGQRLLEAIDEEGPEDAAWNWLVEEVKDPDLLKLSTGIGQSWRRFEREARIARYNRWRDFQQGPERKRRQKRKPVALVPVVEPKVDTAPVMGVGGPVTEIVVWCDLDADATDVEDLVNVLNRRTFAGDEEAPVKVTVKYGDGLVHVPYSLGKLPMTEMDVTRLKKEFRTLIEEVEMVR
ncbi:replication initiation protein [Microvirga tunisiensis]|nr:replication initiation protein [Microvirga tunisiensis]